MANSLSVYRKKMYLHFLFKKCVYVNLYPKKDMYFRKEVLCKRFIIFGGPWHEKFEKPWAKLWKYTLVTITLKHRFNDWCDRFIDRFVPYIQFRLVIGWKRKWKNCSCLGSKYYNYFKCINWRLCTVPRKVITSAEWI